MILAIIAGQAGGGAPPEPGLGYFWRILTSAVDGGVALSVAEFKMYEPDALRTTVATLDAGTPFGSPHYSEGNPTTYAPARAFDGDANTIFATLNGQVQHLGFQFTARAFDIAKFSITARPDGGTYGQSPRDFVMQKSSDGTVWEDVLTITDSSGWAGGMTREWFTRSVVAASMPMSGPDGTTFVDEQGRTWSKSGTPVRVGGFAEFNGASAIYLPSDQQLEPINTDWTVELFGSVNSLANQVFVGKRNSAGYTPFGIGVFGNKLQMLVSQSGGAWAATSAAAADFPVSTEQHVALQRRGNVVELFQQGSLVATGAVTGPVMLNSDPVVLGAWQADASQFPVNGKIRGFKFSQGRALYADGYTVPATP